ncbi:MAG: bifunctional adenosylcobinamide kinase/adenosylcobinamide-phosphate guanylyltransferase [Desulfobacterales bacterium]
MKEIVFVIGGCRSGKSTYAMQTAERVPAEQKIFIATCVPRDDEMKRRVARHQKERSQNWVTVEAPLNLPEAIRQNSRSGDVILVDCLTLWVSNLLMETGDESKIEETISQFINAIEKAAGPIVLVSNEVGTGIVPENALARQYRDIIGRVNQDVAKTAGRVIWMVAGIPVTVKG